MIIRPNKPAAPSAAALRPQQTAQQQAGTQQSDAQVPEEPAEAAVIKDLLKSLVSARPVPPSLGDDHWLIRRDV